jgi:integrase
MFDELAQQYFNNAEGFAAGIKILQRYNDARARNPTFEEMEVNFLDKLDDVTGTESRLLERALEWQGAQQLLTPSPTPQTTAVDVEKAVLTALQKQNASSINSIPLAEAFEQFVEDRRPSWNNDGRTESSFRRDIFQLFHDLVGDIKTGDLQKSHSTLFKQLIQKLPANRSKMPQYKALSTLELLQADVPEEDRVTTVTKQKYLQRLIAFLTWLQRHDYAVPNIEVPLREIARNDKAAHEERARYTDDDLRKLFNSEDYKKGLHKEASRFWVPLIALFTGARLNEICQLHTCDVYQEKETELWVFDINADNAEVTKKSLKRSNHARQIPIHPVLKQLGLLDYLEVAEYVNQNETPWHRI